MAGLISPLPLPLPLYPIACLFSCDLIPDLTALARLLMSSLIVFHVKHVPEIMYEMFHVKP